MSVETTELRKAVAELEGLYGAIKRDLDSRKTIFYTDSALAQDPNGRYILLDALTAVVNAKAALVLAGGE